jgi:hypothetical protein
LNRRLDDVTLDLRATGPGQGPWQPIDHASWPSGADAVDDTGALWDTALPPLASLFARTVEPSAPDVRRRMLQHLGVMPSGEYTFDDDWFAELSALPVRPTDLWLLVTGASLVDVDRPDVSALAAAANGSAHHLLDAAFDALADRLVADGVSGVGTGAPARGAVVDLTQRLRAADLERRRSDIETVARLDDLQAEISALRERLERAEIDAAASRPTRRSVDAGGAE